MKYLVLSAMLMVTISSFSQSQQQNLDKYWSYRDRLREKFVFISSNVEAAGVNIPASARNYTDKVVEWGDANMNMSHYLGVLVTELWLLKQNGQDYSQTLQELYLAMLAMERLDAWSEAHWRYRSNPNSWFRNDADINGMHLRDDVTSNFWDVAKPYLNVAADWTHGSSYSSHDMEEISQDNIYHHMEALALMSSLLGTETIQTSWANFRYDSPIPGYLYAHGIQSGSTVNFSLWAKDLVKRYIDWMQKWEWTIVVREPVFDTKLGQATNHWILVNPVKKAGKTSYDFVQEGSGKDFDLGIFYNAGVLAAALKITGESLRQHAPFIITSDRAREIFEDLFSAGPEPKVLDFSLFGASIKVTLPLDDYKVRSLGTSANILGDGTFARLRANRDRSSKYDYEHMPLIYCALYDEMTKFLTPETAIYNTDRALVEELLNGAPADGPMSGATWSGQLPVYNWSSDSRLVWPEKLGTITKVKEFSGLDYMLLHNLYYLSFRREDFRRIVLPNSPTVDLSNNTFHFRSLVTSDPVNATATTKYVAIESITLKPGFVAAGSSNFTASIGSRANQYQGILYRLPSADGGRVATIRALPEYTNSSSIYTGPINMISLDSIVLYSDDTSTQMMQSSETSGESSQQGLVVFPNPAVAEVSFKFGAPATVTSVELINPQGETVYQIEGQEQEYRVDVGLFPPGLYTVRMQNGDRLLVRRLMIK
jgi:hypothetical protein